MKLWVISDWHLESRLAWQPLRPESFDVLVVAGDVDDDLARAIECVALIADGRPAVFVAGNHEVAGAANDPDMAAAAGPIAEHYGVTWLEQSAADVDGVLFAGATLWEPPDGRYQRAYDSLLAVPPADVIVTHFPPPVDAVHRLLAPGCFWIHGHHHGYADVTLSGRRIVRNALGYANEPVDGEQAIPDLIVDI